ncbi:MAG: hypothetical protein AAGB22_12255, partial [Bacteroidota bacterium]
EFDPRDPDKLLGQKEPYLGSRKSASGAIKITVGIPHNTQPETGGTQVQAQYGDGVPLLRIEGQGNSGQPLDIRQADIDAMLQQGAPWVVRNPIYEQGRTPVEVKIIDPLSVRPGSYTLRFLDSVTSGLDLQRAHWMLTGNTMADTIRSDRSIAVANEQLLLNLGISIEAVQEPLPGAPNSTNNGLVEATIEFANPRSQWLSGVPDVDGNEAQNWIRSGSNQDPDTNLYIDWEGLDPDQDYEGLIGGTWSPYALTAVFDHGPSPFYQKALTGQVTLGSMQQRHRINTGLEVLSNVNVVFTPDRSKWSRVPVLEMQDQPILSIGGADKGFLRESPSVDKDGNPADPNAGPSDNPDDPNYISAVGMGWFPGYAINIETGERLNMAFGEDSWLNAENGDDMQFNPTATISEPLFREVRFGGKHYVYVFENQTRNGQAGMPGYDEGQFMMDALSPFIGVDLTPLLFLQTVA